MRARCSETHPRGPSGSTPPQAELRADCLDRNFGQRPVIYHSNGYDHWMLEGRRYPRRQVQEFYAKDELHLRRRRRETRQSLAAPVRRRALDLVIFDHAHRSVCLKYRGIVDFTNKLLLGLAATPRDEIDGNTRSMFDLGTDIPADCDRLDEVVKDGFLVQAKGVSVPLKLQRENITCAELSAEEKEQWDALWRSDDRTIPDRSEAAAVKRWLLNADTVGKVFEQLVMRGQRGRWRGPAREDHGHCREQRPRRVHRSVDLPLSSMLHG